MTARYDWCPVCGERLYPTKTARMECRTPGCSFKDRRVGNCAMDPLADRREGTNRFIGVVHTDPWQNERTWK